MEFSKEYVYTFTDENGVDGEFTVDDYFDVNGKKYLRLLPRAEKDAPDYLYVSVNPQKRGETALDLLFGDELKRVKETFSKRDFYFLSDDEGKKHQFGVLWRFDFEGKRYVALLPMDMDSDSNTYLLLRIVSDINGEERFAVIEDDDEFNRAADKYEGYIN